MTQPAETFVATFEGTGDQEFPTVQSAMTYAESLDAPTGSIKYAGFDVLLYNDGDVELGPGAMVDGPYPDGEEWPT